MLMLCFVAVVLKLSLVFLLQSTKAVYDRIIDLRIATPQIIINYAMFLEEHNYFEESFKVGSPVTEPAVTQGVGGHM